MNSKTPVNILMVDDEPANLLALTAVLEGLGANLIQAGSGESALRHVLQTNFAVILLDFLMPTMSGLELAEIIRTRSATPIIFITAADLADFPIEKVFSLGAVDYLAKPYNKIVLRSKVAFFIELFKKTEYLAVSERARYLAELGAKEGRIRLILENASGYAFIVTDIAGRITEWEGGAEGVTGWSSEDVVGKSLAIIFTEMDCLEDLPKIEMDVAKKTGASQDKRWHLRKNGTRFYADGVMVPLKDAAGQLHGFTKIFRDATAERLAAEEILASEAKLLQSQTLFSLLLESSVDGIYGLGADSNCTFINPAGAGMLGYLPEELVGRPLSTIIHQQHTAATQDLIAQCRIGEATRKGLTVRVDDEVFWHKDGTPVPVFYSASPIIVDGKPGGTVITFVDVTERRRSEAEREKLLKEVQIVNKQISEVDRRKSEFLATLAHELRNPLAPIRSGLDLMKLSGNSLKVVAETRDMMERQVTHMVRLVDDLLDIARISGGKIDLKKELINVNSVIASAVDISLPLIEAGQHDLAIDLPDEPIVILADPVRIAQVIANLLNNAAKYTPLGGHIGVTASAVAGEVILSVRDNGVGIPKELLPSIFDMFSQVNCVDSSGGGLGIGLSLVRQLVDMHGGAIEVYSEPGSGSTFVVKFPLVFVSTQSAEAPSVIKVANNKPQNDVAPLRIMVVDDNVDAAVSLSDLLAFKGHISQVAHDGHQALMLATEFKPHVAFLDIGMPGLDGYETVKELRNISGLEQLILVALTGRGTAADRAKSSEAGFNFHLTKPAQLDAINELLAKVER